MPGCTVHHIVQYIIIVQEYIHFMLRWRLDRGITTQLNMLKKGFSEVCATCCLCVDKSVCGALCLIKACQCLVHSFIFLLYVGDASESAAGI